MTAEDDIDRLYAGKPEDFTALRTQLAAAAKKSGDADGAKQIAAARRPTTAAWVVNALVRSDDSVRVRLSDLSERLRAAHSSMDGARIRELSAAQRKLIDELVRTGFDATGLTDPSAALRDDVVGTLQAAIADPEVAAQLGTLAKAERWSGFGEFGATTAIVAERIAEAPPPGPSAAEVRTARKRKTAAEAAVRAAQTAHADAVEAVGDRLASVKAARRRYEKLLEALSVAERELNAADAEHGEAEATARAAAAALAAARADLAGLE
ncbi:MAG TPA: hypothetical protein VF477_08675 [Mycobacterium sp.]